MKPFKLVSCLVLAACLLCALPVHAQLTVTPLNDRCVVLTTFEPVSGFIMNNPVENAHSGADLVVYLEHSNIVYTGDVYFGGMYPIIDRYAGGTLNGTLHALRQMLARIDDDTIVVPSHGAIGTRRSVLEFVHLLETAKSRIRSLIAQGFTEEQVLAAAPMADFDAAWGGGFVPRNLFTLIVYRDLAPGGKPR